MAQRDQQETVIAEFNADVQAMAAAIVDYRHVLRVLADAVALAQAGAPFALIGPGPLWKPRAASKVDAKSTTE